MSEDTEQIAVIVASPKSWKSWVESEVRTCRECDGEVWASPTSVKMETEHDGPVEYLCMPCMAADMPEELLDQPFRAVPGAMDEVEKNSGLSAREKSEIRGLLGMPVRELRLEEAYPLIEKEQGRGPSA